jgi:hypothetical protein
VNKNNAVHAIVFEAVAVAIGLEEPELLAMGGALLAKFLAVREPNLRYLALESMTRLAEVPAVAETVSRWVQQSTKHVRLGSMRLQYTAGEEPLVFTVDVYVCERSDFSSLGRVGFAMLVE